jgi:hypothetical protein
MNKEIHPFKCAKCGSEYAAIVGGRCSVCGKLFCSEHLNSIKDQNTKKNILYCTDCRPGMAKETLWNRFLKIPLIFQIIIVMALFIAMLIMVTVVDMWDTHRGYKMSETEVQQYFLGHEEFWLKSAPKVKEKRYGKVNLATESANQQLIKDIKSDKKLKKMLRKFKIFCYHQEENDCIAIYMDYKYWFDGGMEVKRSWKIYYLTDENNLEAIKLRNEAKARPKDFWSEKDYYYWTFGDHWIGMSEVWQ